MSASNGIRLPPAAYPKRPAAAFRMTAVETHSLPGLVTLLGEIFPPCSIFPVEERVTGEHHLLHVRRGVGEHAGVIGRQLHRFARTNSSTFARTASSSRSGHLSLTSSTHCHRPT